MITNRVWKDVKKSHSLVQHNHLHRDGRYATGPHDYEVEK
jgi:hypothetical protein